ncbi:unnamed protein product [Vitrella brassicaformis CCMP3155]|uniref:Ubiquitin-like domain-containing protein n=3 Tax=Vitrella brassicaformis TaxID=1169539 RepID=A0A0G4FM41_VITBC|nr:unnamed protein product [Vitrella brassicaformis CCMP3155]|eukprot:CEM14888.1 unnamed protein product [Vitrella brassicaformis CCMP3155]
MEEDGFVTLVFQAADGSSSIPVHRSVLLQFQYFRSQCNFYESAALDCGADGGGLSILEGVTRDVAAVVLQRPASAIVQGVTSGNLIDVLAVIDFLGFGADHDQSADNRESLNDLLKQIAAKVVDSRWCDDVDFSVLVLKQIPTAPVVTRLIQEDAGLLDALCSCLFARPRIIKDISTPSSEPDSHQCVRDLVEGVSRQMSSGVMDPSSSDLATFLTEATGSQDVKQALGRVFEQELLGDITTRPFDHSMSDPDEISDSRFVTDVSVQPFTCTSESRLSDVTEWAVRVSVEQQARATVRGQVGGGAFVRCFAATATVYVDGAPDPICSIGDKLPQSPLRAFGLVALGSMTHTRLRLTAPNLPPAELSARGVSDKTLADVVVRVQASVLPMCEIALHYLRKCAVERSWGKLKDMACALDRRVSERLLQCLTDSSSDRLHGIVGHWLPALAPNVTAFDDHTLSCLMASDHVCDNQADIAAFRTAVVPLLSIAPVQQPLPQHLTRVWQSLGQLPWGDVLIAVSKQVRYRGYYDARLAVRDWLLWMIVAAQCRRIDLPWHLEAVSRAVLQHPDLYSEVCRVIGMREAPIHVSFRVAILPCEQFKREDDGSVEADRMVFKDILGFEYFSDLSVDEERTAEERRASEARLKYALPAAHERWKTPGVEYLLVRAATCTGTKGEFLVRPSATVYEVKLAIRRRTGIPITEPWMYCVINRRMPLDTETMEECNVQNGSTIALLTRWRW